MYSLILAISLSAAATSSLQKDNIPYDPVTRAIALCITPEEMDLEFDEALRLAESCDEILKTISCSGERGEDK